MGPQQLTAHSFKLWTALNTHHSGERIMMSETDKNPIKCYWCSLPTNTFVRCPLRYNPPQQFRVYTASGTDFSDKNVKNVMATSIYSINENVCKADAVQHKTQSLQKCAHYDTYGWFCSNACCCAFILDKRGHDGRFELSFLLLREYYDGPAALHWDKLDEFGGPLSREEWSKKFADVDSSIRVRTFTFQPPKTSKIPDSLCSQVTD